MNAFSPEARRRTELYESIAKREGYILLAGRYGGEFNNDQLALRDDGMNTTLLLGLKVTSGAGDIQLDQQSMGPHQQFSYCWLLAVIQSLKLHSAQAELATVLEQALSAKTLILALLLVARPDGDVKVVRVSLPEPAR